MMESREAARLAIAGLERAMRPALLPLLLATEIHLHTTDTQYIFAHSEPVWSTYYRYTSVFLHPDFVARYFPRLT